MHFGDRFFLQRYVPLALIGIYALIMRKLDKEYGVDEGDLE